MAGALVPPTARAYRQAGVEEEKRGSRLSAPLEVP